MNNRYPHVLFHGVCHDVPRCALNTLQTMTSGVGVLGLGEQFFLGCGYFANFKSGYVGG